MALFFLSIGSNVFAHCQIPCGIYDDEARFVQLREHIQTIEKSMNQINELAEAEKPSVNQQVRWVNNKDDHANAFTEIVTYYFMAQRIKPVEKEAKGYAKYQSEVELLHQMVVYAMKTKQTTDLAHVEKLRSLVDAFEASYLGQDAGHSKHQH